MKIKEYEITNGNGGYETETYYTTEEYWTWDYAGEEDFHIDRFKYLGQEFKYGEIKFNNIEYKETINESYYVRYVYYVIPSEFYGSLFTYIKNNTINDNQFYENKSIEDVISQKEDEPQKYIIIFWTLWIIVVIIIIVMYVCLKKQMLKRLIIKR